MRQYLDLMKKILDEGQVREDRTGTGTIGLFGEQLKIDLSEGFPLLTTKRIPFKSVVAELLWFLRGRTDVASLRADGCTIWDEWATEEQCARFGREEGDLGPIYGWAWRHFGANYRIKGERGFDQIQWLVDEIKKNPYSRRLVVSAWHPEDAAVVALPPCHTLFQCCVQNSAVSGYPTRRLSLHLYMRSADYFLGVPFNIASYALLMHLLAEETGLGLGTLTISFGDVHLYRNHLDQAREQLSREPRPLPGLVLAKSMRTIFEREKEEIAIASYDPWPAIKAQVSV